MLFDWYVSMVRYVGPSHFLAAKTSREGTHYHCSAEQPVSGAQILEWRVGSGVFSLQQIAGGKMMVQSTPS